MARGKYAAVRVSDEEKERLQVLAASLGVRESALLKRTIESLLDPGRVEVTAISDRPPEGARLAKVMVCLHPDVRDKLAERAKARGLPVATYIAALVRSHVLNLRPLPKAEIRSFEEGVRQLLAIGRNLNQLARRANAEKTVVLPRREDLALFIKTCTAMTGHLRAALKANMESWRVGHE